MVHGFTNPMVRDFHGIKRVPQVQIIIDLDGWGDKTLKKSSYMLYAKKDPVQFTGFKIFIKMISNQEQISYIHQVEVLSFQPKPIHIQYQ